MAKQTYWNQAIAEQELSAWRSSGQSLAEYARGRGVRVQRLYRWKRWLAESAGPGRRPRPAPSFLPVRVVKGVGTESGSFEIVMGEPVRVRVPADFDAAALSRLLGALAGC